MVAKDEGERLQWVAWRASGLTADELAARRGQSPNRRRYSAYRRKKPEPVVRSLERVRVERRAAPASVQGGGTSTVIELAEAKVIVPPGVDAATLRVVLRRTASPA